MMKMSLHRNDEAVLGRLMMNRVMKHYNWMEKMSHYSNDVMDWLTLKMVIKAMDRLLMLMKQVMSMKDLLSNDLLPENLT